MSKQLILIIDDNPDDLFFIKEALEETFDIATATSAEEGLRKAEVLLPILIILDMNLGKVNGYEVFEELKVSENTQTIPVIFNTGHHTEIDELKALRAGAIDYIEKSHSLDLLKQRVISITSLIKSTRDNTINSALPSLNKIQTSPNPEGLSDTDDTHSFDEFKNKLSIYEEEFTAQQESLEAQIELSRIESEKFSELFFYSPIGILHIDQNGKILLFNHLANIYLGGIRKGQIFYPKLLSLSEKKNNSELFSWFYPQKGSPNEIELSIRLDDKSHFYKLTRSLFQGNHIFITIFDITEAYETRLREKQIQTQQQRLLERIALATDIAGLGTWKDDFVSNVYEIDEITQNMLNIHKEKITLEELAEIVVPEDIPLVVESRQKAMQTQENDELYFRALVKNEKRYFYAKWRYFYDAEQLLNTIGFLKDITDEKKALEQANQLELQRQLNKAQKQITQAAVEANKNKTLFLANMSHEFRTPLHAINSFTSMAQKLNEASGFDKLPRYLDFIKTSTERLIRLVNDLLDLSRLEIGDIKLNKSPTNLLELSRSVIDELDSIAVAKNIHINQTADDDLALINLDMGLINQLITNLISNALKFSPDGGLIEITIRKGQATLYGQSVPAVYYSVVDEGVGIPEEETEVIFDKFRQSTKTATGAGGTGLGLAICREIITLHDGKIYAVSPPPDKEKGAMLEFYLPIADSGLKHDF